MLSRRQEVIMESMIQSIKKKDNYILSSHQRKIGKTSIISELGLHLQSLNYKVLLLTTNMGDEYYVDKMLKLSEDDYLGLIDTKTVVLLDEYDYCKIDNLIKYCKGREIPVVGYASMKDDEVKFKREYQYNWVE